MLFAFTTALSTFATAKYAFQEELGDTVSCLAAVFDLLVAALATVVGVLVLTSFSDVQNWLRGAALERSPTDDETLATPHHTTLVRSQVTSNQENLRSHFKFLRWVACDYRTSWAGRRSTT